jgi:hypothetical protein
MPFIRHRQGNLEDGYVASVAMILINSWNNDDLLNLCNRSPGKK